MKFSSGCLHIFFNEVYQLSIGEEEILEERIFELGKHRIAG